MHGSAQHNKKRKDVRAADLRLHYAHFFSGCQCSRLHGETDVVPGWVVLWTHYFLTTKTC